MKHVIQLILTILLLCQQGYSQNLYVFMKVDGINGSYTFPGNTTDGNNSIELKNFRFIETNSINIGSSTSSAGGGRAEAPKIEFVSEPMDKAIVSLYEKMMMAAQAAVEIRIHVYSESGGAYYPIEVIKLKNPRVVEISASGAGGNSSGVATEVKLKYHAIHKTGYNYVLGTFTPSPEPITIMQWNYTTNTGTY